MIKRYFKKKNFLFYLYQKIDANFLPHPLALFDSYSNLILKYSLLPVHNLFHIYTIQEFIKIVCLIFQTLSNIVKHCLYFKTLSMPKRLNKLVVEKNV